MGCNILENNIHKIKGVGAKMLDINRLSSLTLLKKNGWMPENRIDLEQRYAKLEKNIKVLGLSVMFHKCL